MRKVMNILCCCVALLVIGRAPAAPHYQESSAPATQVVEMTGDKYAFSPAEIHVKKGTRVQIKLHSVDKEHGIKIDSFTEGAKKNRPPGLRFEGKNDTGKVAKGADALSSL